MKSDSELIRQALIGCMIGTAVGDARGLPYEGLSRRRLNRLFPCRGGYHLLFGYGLCSDDTEHAFMVGQALLSSTLADQDQQMNAFKRSLAWRLRFWLLGFPAGLGLATLQSIIKLWLGFSPDKSGVWSAGNGPAMRAPLLGLWCRGDLVLLRRLIRISTRITHSDPQAESGALCLAWTAYFAVTEPDISQATMAHALHQTDLLYDQWIAKYWDQVTQSLLDQQTTLDFAQTLGCPQGITGYMGHSIPIVLHAFLSHPNDFDAATQAVIDCGGDTDSTAAMVGALVGGRVGETGIPSFLLDRLIEWPMTLDRLKKLADRLSMAMTDVSAVSALPNYPWHIVAVLVRNGLFFMVVLAHVVRRMLPPW